MRKRFAYFFVRSSRSYGCQADRFIFLALNFSILAVISFVHAALL